MFCKFINNNCFLKSNIAHCYLILAKSISWKEISCIDVYLVLNVL